MTELEAELFHQLPEADIGLARTQFVIARSAATWTWRSRHPKNGSASNEIATLRSQ